MYGEIMIIGHRGFPTVAPENTIPSFRRAMKSGADGIELDVHLSKDGVPVVCHDEKLERTTNGQGLIADHTLEELKKLDAGSWFSAEFAGTPMPTLEEVCKLMTEWDGWLNIELKTNVIPYPGIEEAVLALIRKYDLVERTMISSFNHYTIKTWHDLAPAVPAAILYSNQLYQPWRYARTVGAAGLHPHHSTVTPELVKEALTNGISIRPWTVNKHEDIKRLMLYGVTGLITDRPDLAARA
ncbi:MAG TPA: glycerophosphodiester phosphodiesterase [Firmicutes bacterium]|nr:glycerophosphodiester phosphodiesterase [Bacillota bacterium]